jgi:predicted RecB family nuclease
MSSAAAQASREAAIANLVSRSGEGDACQGIAVTAATLKQGAPLLADATLEDDDISLRLDTLRRADGASMLGEHYYLPVLHNHGDKVGGHQKLLLAVFGLVLERVQGLRPDVGLVARGPEARLGKVRLDARLYRQAEQVLGEVKRLQSGGEPPRLALNDHCRECEFRDRCHAEAVEKDDISLLRVMSDAELRKHRSKGIFTVTQLAYTFRPRRKGKRTRGESPPHHAALQALAIRDGKTYVLGKPEVPHRPVRVYLDLEGVTDGAGVYLLGALVVKDGVETMHSFWADEPDGEGRLLARLLEVVGDDASSTTTMTLRMRFRPTTPRFASLTYILHPLLTKTRPGRGLT